MKNGLNFNDHSEKNLWKKFFLTAQNSTKAVHYSPKKISFFKKGSANSVQKTGFSRKKNSSYQFKKI